MKCKECSNQLRWAADDLGWQGHRTVCGLFGTGKSEPGKIPQKPKPRRRAKPFRRWEFSDGLLYYLGETVAWEELVMALNKARVVLPAKVRP